ncbi:MAG TPA: hypothetical protein VMI54_15485 [Polyangiaceae bacterium]|nr:hypothetical protein [Polyangiaceae bacterium]
MNHGTTTFVAAALLALSAHARAQELVRDTPSPPDAANEAPTKKISLGFAAGGEFRELYGIPITAVDVRGTLAPLAARKGMLLPGLFASVLVGATKEGLGVGHVLVGPRFEARSRYFFAGLSAGFGYFWIDRAGGDPMGNFDAAADVFGGPQIPLGHLALALEARFSAELLPGTDATFAYGPGLAVRLRFD